MNTLKIKITLESSDFFTDMLYTLKGVVGILTVTSPENKQW